MKFAQIAVVGAGNMGSGIAQKIATEGLSVTLVDSSQELADRGKKRIEQLLIEGMDRGLFSPEQLDEILARITAVGQVEKAAGADLVIEAVFEDLKVKQELFTTLGQVVRPDTILATNTSSFLVSDVARVTDKPQRVVGLHFFYHPAKNRLVEVIGHDGTDPQVLEDVWRLQGLFGKTPIASKDAPGYVVNRYFVPWLNEAVRLYEEGLSIATIEQVGRGAFGIGMGPFELMNVTGIPITLHAAHALADRLGDFYAPAAAIGLQVTNDTPWNLDGEVDLGAADQVTDRLWGVVFHVALKLVSDGVGSIDDVDIGARVGLRWPVGPFEMMNTLGVGKTTQLCHGIEKRYSLNEPTALSAQRDSGKPFLLERVKLTLKDDVGTILINRPDKLNALDPETIQQLDARFTEAQKLDDVKTIVIAGAGKAFVAGADVKYFVDRMRSNEVDEIVEFAASGQTLFRRIERSDKPVVCLLDGMALGGGAELALACHTVVATPSASMGFPETGIGIYPGLGGTQRLARRVGKGIARFLIYSGKIIDASDLLGLKIAWRVVDIDQIDATIAEAAHKAPKQQVSVPEDVPKHLQEVGRFLGAVSVTQLMDGSLTLPGGMDVMELARKIRQKAPEAIRRVERLTKLAEDEPDDIDLGLKAETDGLRTIFASKDALEGMTAMLERRKPKFVGA